METMERITLILQGRLYEIPDGDVNTPEFVEFCEGHGCHPQNSPKRAWLTGGDPCIYDEDKYLVYLDNASTGHPLILTEEELTQFRMENTP